MTLLLDHAQAYRVLAEVLADEAEECGDEGHALLLTRLSKAHFIASNRLKDIVADQRVDHRCTIDHKAIPAGKRCPACGAPRG